MGAWEHSYSSNYVYSEAEFEAALDERLPDTIAHEFYHVVTPLNIHSEIIEQFNFVEPVPSEHLWLYEGVTEWAALKMQLNAGLMSIEDYLREMSEKLKIAEHFSADYSLQDIALKSYTEAGQQQFANV